MNVEGPALEPLLHRLTDCPSEFLEVVGQDNPAGVDVVAIVCDLLRTLTPDSPPELEASHLAAIRQRTVAELTLISITCWLLSDPWFLGQPHLSPLTWHLLVSETWGRLAGLVRPTSSSTTPIAARNSCGCAWHSWDGGPKANRPLRPPIA